MGVVDVAVVMLIGDDFGVSCCKDLSLVLVMIAFGFCVLVLMDDCFFEEGNCDFD